MSGEVPSRIRLDTAGPTDRMKRLRVYVDQLVIERAELQKHVRRLQDETLALQAQLARQAVKDSLRGMEE